MKLFEAERHRLRGVAYRLLGSAADAEDAVQETWLRLQTADIEAIHNPRAWLTTVVSRIAIDMLRARERRQEIHDDQLIVVQRGDARSHLDPEDEALLAESIGIAMLVVLDRLKPAERVAFVLHDFFALPFKDIATIIACSPDAARQLASRGRRAIQGTQNEGTSANLAQQRDLVEAFFAASRGGDMAALIRVLDANVTLTVDPVLGGRHTVRGADAVARRARLGAAHQRAAQVMLVNGRAGIIVAPNGKPGLAMTFLTSGFKITEITILAEPRALTRLQLTVLD